jgi:type II secretory pathway component PulK
MKRRDERGIALIGALGALLLLVAIATPVALAARQQGWTGGEHERRAGARWAAEAGVAVVTARVQASLAELALALEVERLALALETDTEAQQRARDALRALNAIDSVAAAGAVRLPNGTVAAARVVDATARLNLNAADEPELRAFFRQWVLDERELARLVDALLDWRDEDDLVRAQGAEQDAYDRRGGVRVRNAPLVSVDELSRIRGFTPQLVRQVEPFVTVLPTQELRINVNAAPLEVLVAVPGFTPELAVRLLARRARTGPVLSASEIAADAELAPLLDRVTAAGAVRVIAVRPELLEVISTGAWEGGSPARHVIRTRYAVEPERLRPLERQEGDR